MSLSNRKAFLQTASLLFAGAFTGFSFDVKNTTPKLSFSTLGCPDWTFTQIIDFAVQNNYTGIELRGIQRQLDLTKCKEFINKQNIADTLKIMEDKSLHFVDLGSSAMMHFTDASKRKAAMDEAKSFIDLAQKIKCPFIRVFPNELPKDQNPQATLAIIAKALRELGEYAKGSNVTVLMETHGDLVKSIDIETVMQAAAGAHVGLVWDIANMWSITKEPPAEVYKKLKKYIHHTHVKDFKLVDNKIQYTLLKEGEVPIFTAIDILANDGYKGYYSFEWEKMWHPEIAAPEIALADYPLKMKAHFR